MFLAQQPRGPWHRRLEEQASAMHWSRLNGRVEWTDAHSGYYSFTSASSQTNSMSCVLRPQTTTGSFFSIREYWTCVKRDKGLPGLLATRFCQDASVRACTEACHVRKGSTYERGLKHKLVSFTDFSSSGYATPIANWEASRWVNSGHPVMCTILFQTSRWQWNSTSTVRMDWDHWWFKNQPTEKLINKQTTLICIHWCTFVADLLQINAVLLNFQFNQNTKKKKYRIFHKTIK